MKSICVPGMALIALSLPMAGWTRDAAEHSPASCSAPESILKRFEIDLPGPVRETRSVDVPANTELLIEAFEKGNNSRIELRAPGATVVTAESALHRWPPYRLIVAAGRARTVEITAIGLERSHGRVDVQISHLATRTSRCVDFLRAMASGDAAYSRGAMIFRAEIDAPPGASATAYESAVSAYARAARILGPGGFDEAQAQLVYASALMNSVERFPESLQAASIAEERFKSLGDEFGRDLARFHWAYSMTYVAMREEDAAEAKRKFETARNMFTEIVASHQRRGERFELALALDGLACTAGFLFRFNDAIAEYQRALEIFNDLGEPDRAVAMRVNLAHFEEQFGRYEEALNHHLEILAEGDNVKDPAVVISNLRNVAFIELKLGKYDDALRHYSDAYARALRMQSKPDEAWVLYGLGNTYRLIGNYSEALTYLERSLELRSEQQRPRDRAITLRTLANVLGEIGRGREAVARREEALRGTRIPPEKARITLELIDDRIKVGDLAIAKSLTAELLAAHDLPDPAYRIGATLANARIALAEGDVASARRDARIAAEFYQAHELVSSEFEALLVQARAACAAGARDEARSLAESALQRAEEIRTFSSNPTLRASLWRPQRPAFGFTIGLLARPNSCGADAPADALGALAIAESSRGRALEDFRLRSSTKPDSKASEKRRELFEQLAGVRQQLETLSKTASADDERLRVLRIEAARLRREIDLSGGLPASNKVRTADLGTALRARIDAIPKDTAVVEYWIGKDEAFAWLLTRGRVQFVDLGPPARIDTAARLMHESMRSWLSGTVEQRIARARELHQLIIAPLPSDISHARTVYFIPDGALHAVPFAALAQSGRAETRFFVDSHDVAVAPAFLAIAPDAELPTVRRSSRALVVVDPVYARDDARFERPVARAPGPVESAKTLRGSRTWTRLPATAREAATIRKLLDREAVQVLAGFDATRDSLLERDLGRYEILHFATHAVADMEAPQLSALVLSTVDAQGASRIGEVFAGDLADQRMGASLVVFSGCETALGRTEAGEGLQGLRYAAHASGARAVVASLWPVMDATGPRLMDDLYAEVIGRSASPVAALSRAMRMARKNWDDPALWASFDVSIAGF